MRSKREKDKGKRSGRGRSTGRAQKQPKKEKFIKQSFNGIVRMTREGYAFIEVEGLENDVFVPAHRMRGALNGDFVKVQSIKSKGIGRDGKAKKIDGEVIEILQRSAKAHIGILQVSRGDAWLIMESRFMPYDIHIPIEEIDRWFNDPCIEPDDFGHRWKRSSVSGLKAAVLVTDWPRKAAAPIGTIIDVLGEPGANDTEMHAILSEYGLPYRFEKEVEDAAETISEKITAKDIEGRRDFRSITTFTIDPADAKDFDDALSYRVLPNGNLEVGIHIADVSHYVRPGDAIDRCAYERGTSVYLVDRTIPMLPEKLSNTLCSLRPNEEKLCYSAVFEITPKAVIKERWFGRTIICSDHRFSYEEAQAIIESGEGHLSAEILALHSLATQLRKKRFASGAISFERPEMKVEVNAEGTPIRVYERISKEANWLIEEFMLLANKYVAEFIGKANKRWKSKARTFVYRIHENPNEEKLSILRKFVRVFGFDFPGGNPADAPKGSAKGLKKIGGKTVAERINNLLGTVKGKPEEEAVVMMALRSMARARYSTDNVGHYGLAFDFYTHFTSPIRRYPDLMVHRLLDMYIDGAESQNKEFYEACSKHCSAREQTASDAERASIKYKLCEFMNERVGQIYPGTVSGLTEWGLYVETEPDKVEGMVALREITEDFYQFDEDSYSIIGKGRGRRFTMGSKVWIRVKNVSIEQKLIDYELVEEPKE